MSRESFKAVERAKKIASMNLEEQYAYLKSEKGSEPARDSAGSRAAQCSASPCDQETWLLIRDLRNALAVASRVIVSCFATDVFIAETKQCGIPDGIGTRSQEWLDTHSPNSEVSQPGTKI